MCSLMYKNQKSGDCYEGKSKKLMELLAHEVEKNHDVVFLATLKESGFPNQASLNLLKKEGFEKDQRGIYLRFTLRMKCMFFKGGLQKAYTHMKRRFICMACPT